MVIALALGAALMYGVSDFMAGLASRRASLWAVAVVTQGTALVLIGLAAIILPGRPEMADLLWGAVAGVGMGGGTGFLYRGLSSARMGIVAPLSAVGAALLPVVVGLATGERPPLLTWVGMAAAIPAIWLVSSSADGGATAEGRFGEGVIDGLLAGIGFGVMFAALGQVPEEAGLFPVAVADVTSVPAVIVLAAALRQDWVPRERLSWWGMPVGALVAAASVLYLFATQTGLLAVAAVITSLYPVFTILLAATILRERVHGPQAVGLVLAGVAVSLIAIG